MLRCFVKLMPYALRVVNGWYTFSTCSPAVRAVMQAVRGQGILMVGFL